MNSLNGKIIQNLRRLNKRVKSSLESAMEQTNLDKKLVFSLAKSRWPSLKQLKYINRYLSPAERLALCGCLIIIFASSLFLAGRFYQAHAQTIPVNGGDYAEGVIGTVKYINPLYANVSDVNGDIAGLVYSSLFKRNANGRLVNDLAENYEISQDGRTYIIKVRADARWHNGSALSVYDVIFTFQAIKNPDYKSPLRNSFGGVEIEKVDDQTVRFNLTEPYAAFLELLTFGILPQELWQQIEPAAAGLAELNLKPVGSSRYKFKSLVKDRSGNIKTYNLVRNNDYYGDKPYINSVSFKLFGHLTELLSALNNNLINGISHLPDQARSEVVAQDSLNFYRLNLPRLSIIFFNSKRNPALADKKVRQALAYAIDKNKILSQAVAGNGREIDGPILPESFAYDGSGKKYYYDAAGASRLLEEAGWKIMGLTAEDIDKAKQDLAAKDEATVNQAKAKINLGPGKWRVKNNNYLTIELTTVDNPEYGRAADLAAEFWRAVNIKASVNLLPASQMQSEVIKTRNFSALFYGEIVGADPDPYVFWHSSQTGPGGLNLADYANKEVDKLLEEARLTNDVKARREKYKKFQEILIEDQPAIFLYSPYYTYLQTKNIKGFNVNSIVSPSDRLANISQWYIKTGKKFVW